jgi:hypothetical protein
MERMPPEGFSDSLSDLARARLLCTVFGHAPIRGAEEEGEAPDSGSDLGNSDGPAPAGDGGTSPGDVDDAGAPAAAEESGAEDWKFDIENVPEGLRSDAQKLHQQFKREFTQKTQELAAEREAHREALETWSRLQDESTAEETLNELAERLGFEPNVEGSEEGYEEAEDDEEGAEDLDPTVAALKAEVEALKAERDGEMSEKRQEAIREHVLSGIDGYADSLGVDELDPAISKAIMLQSLSLPSTEAGMPDIEGAISAWREAEQAAIEAYVASKDVEAPQVDGSSGVETMDTSDPVKRREAMNAIAARRFASQ